MFFVNDESEVLSFLPIFYVAVASNGWVVTGLGRPTPAGVSDPVSAGEVIEPLIGAGDCHVAAIICQSGILGKIYVEICYTHNKCT